MVIKHSVVCPSKLNQMWLAFLFCGTKTLTAITPISEKKFEIVRLILICAAEFAVPVPLA